MRTPGQPSASRRRPWITLSGAVLARIPYLYDGVDAQSHALEVAAGSCGAACIQLPSQVLTHLLLQRLQHAHRLLPLAPLHVHVDQDVERHLRPGGDERIMSVTCGRTGWPQSRNVVDTEATKPWETDVSGRQPQKANTFGGAGEGTPNVGCRSEAKE